jgi:hypothetical protein
MVAGDKPAAGAVFAKISKGLSVMLMLRFCGLLYEAWLVREGNCQLPQRRF